MTTVQQIILYQFKKIIFYSNIVYNLVILVLVKYYYIHFMINYSSLAQKIIINFFRKPFPKFPHIALFAPPPILSYFIRMYTTMNQVLSPNHVAKLEFQILLLPSSPWMFDLENNIYLLMVCFLSFRFICTEPVLNIILFAQFPMKSHTQSQIISGFGNG